MTHNTNTNKENIILFNIPALSTGCMERLKLLLKDDDGLCRAKTTQALYILTAHSLGR